MRALLIQKDVKHSRLMIRQRNSLRALLIQKDVKPKFIPGIFPLSFESFVNSERCKTIISRTTTIRMFESFVNSERCKTRGKLPEKMRQFESFVNSERCKTQSPA